MPGGRADRQGGMLKLIAPAAVIAALATMAACAPVSTTPAPAPLSPSATRGLAFAKANCAGCHAVEGNASSPNAEAPPFAAIANMPDLTRETLRQYLRDSHNYPEAMNFTVEAEQIDDLADYVVTLQRPDYKPDI